MADETAERTVQILQQEATQLARQQEVDRVLKLSALDPFSILQIPQTSTPTDVKAAYRAKSRLIHPDKTAHPQARQAFERLKAAESDLMDDEKRHRILAMIEEARRELQSEWKQQEQNDQQHRSADEVEKLVMARYRKIMVDLEWRRRQRVKQEMAREGEAGRREEEMAATKRRKQEKEKAWEESRDERVRMPLRQSLGSPTSAGHRASVASELSPRTDPGHPGPVENSISEPDEEDQHSDNDSEDDDEEPALRYKRLGGSVDALFEKDTASALAAAERFLVLGTHWGNIMVIDFEGNKVQRWRAHSATVNSVSVDAAGEYVASAGDDGRVVVRALYTDDVTIVDYSRPVKAVALDPQYSRRASRRFLSGGTSGQVIVHEKRWYGKGDTILFSSAGPIQAIQWHNDLVAWACDEGVQIYDMKEGARISQIARPQGSPRADVFACRMHWRDCRTLVVGWADYVQVVVLRERTGAQSPVDASGPSLYAEISVLFRTDFVVCGLAQHHDHLLVLSYGDSTTTAVDAVGQQRVRDAQPPELRMISRDLEEEASDVLALDGFPLLQPNDYALAHCAAANSDCWFVLSPKQLVSVRPRGLHDHVQWLAERADYKQALNDIEDARNNVGRWASSRDEVRDTEYQTIGEAHAQALMDIGDTHEAALVCARVLPRTADPEAAVAWETWVFAFAEAHALQDIAPHLPTGEPQLTSTAYEMVLAFLLATDTEQFRQLVLEWPPSLYNAYSVVLAAEDRLQKMDASEVEASQQLARTMALLYDRLNQPSKSLRFYLELFEPEILDRVRRENLFDAVRDKAELIMRYDDHMLNDNNVQLSERSQASGVQLLTDNTDAIPSASVVKQLVKSPEHLHVYLHALRGRDTHLSAPFADLQLELYAEYDPHLLLGFLRTSSAYTFDRALEVCEERALVPEMVYILGRMGDNHRALMLIIDKLRDVPRAIEFAREQGDPALWNDLVMYARDKPEFIVGLLELGGASARPTRVIRAIPPALRVPGIRRALARVLHDHHLQVDLSTDCRRILDRDCDVLSDRLRRLQHQGISSDGAQLCLACQQPLEEQMALSANTHSRSALAFWCGHVFHDACVLLPEVLSKTQLPSPFASSVGLGAIKLKSRVVRGPRDQRAMLTQAKLDRSMLIRQFAPACPVCAEYDQQIAHQTTHSGWSPSERRDRDQVSEPTESASKNELPPMQSLQI
ncbi:Vacuolar protein sorting-associated protein 41 [Coemansia sp. IMI 203386]|nr:Vacuolar protein sorting-associated protein 41 [Coemansia sp. IMI 203386]